MRGPKGLDIVLAHMLRRQHMSKRSARALGHAPQRMHRHGCAHFGGQMRHEVAQMPGSLAQPNGYFS